MSASATFNFPLVSDSARTAVAATAAFLVARLAGLPEAYWAPIVTAVVIQSKLGAAWQISCERFIGTILGAVVGGLSASLHPPSWWLFGLGVFVLGILCGVLKTSNSYRFSVITLAIIELVPRDDSRWIIALHRSAEVIIGIAVGLVITALWHDRSEGALQ